jgi:putative redox protein
MSGAFREVYEVSRAKLRAKPEKQIATLRVDSSLVKGFESRVSVRDHTVTVDQPLSFGGGDKGPKPGEYLLAGLAACQEVTYRLYADALGIPLNAVRVTITATQDLRGFLNLEEGVSPGFQEVTGVVHLDSTAPRADLERLKAVVDAHCPVLDDLRRPIPVEISLA